jgi:hypothetical protein
MLSGDAMVKNLELLQRGERFKFSLFATDVSLIRLLTHLRHMPL